VEIDRYVANNHDLRRHELRQEDWAAIASVTTWLRSFRDATVQMSMTRHPTLSHVQAIFHGLIDDIRASIQDLSPQAPPGLRVALLRAHRKLTDYFFTCDQSPYYVWASGV
jgi:hypothetical protein